MENGSGSMGVRHFAGAALLALCVGCVSQPVAVEEPEQSLAAKAESRRNLGIDNLSKGHVALAIRELTYADSLEPNDKHTQLWLGEAYRRKALFDEAESHILKSVEIAPDFQAARINLAALYIQMERFDDSIEQSEMLVVDPTFPTPWQALTNLGWAQYKLGNRVEARASLRRALDYHPTYWPALLDLGILENDEGHRMRALDRFRQVLAARIGRQAKAETNYRMGEVFVALGRRDLALRHFTEAAESAPYARWGVQSKKYLALLQ